MKTHISFYIGRFWFELGWFSGEPLTLVTLKLFEITEGYPNKIDLVTIFGLQVLKFTIGFGLS